MKLIRLYILAAPVLLAACQSIGDRDTIARLRDMQIEIKEERIEGGLEKAMLGYQRFLEETSDSGLTPEAIRRLADLKIEKEYGALTPGAAPAGEAPAWSAPKRAARPAGVADGGAPSRPSRPPAPVYDESEAEFEKRATRMQQGADAPAAEKRLVEGTDDLERAGAREAVALYSKLLHDYPLYERNDQVLYQMSRAYEELGQPQAAMEVMQRLVRGYPRSRYIDEVQFRRAEYFFAHRRYLDAEEAYASIVGIGPGSFYYELALYKLGWTFYKQELYEDALHRFIALLDHKVSSGYDFEQTEDEQERKRTEDTFRVISLSFSILGGADYIVEYFPSRGAPGYEDIVYRNLGEFYFDKRRYADASAVYNAYVSRHPFHKVAPGFHMRIIEIQAAGGFPSLVLDYKKKFATTYGLKAEYWEYFDPKDRPEVLSCLKTNLTDLANHYHACYQDPRQAEGKPANFKEALHWYREYLESFPAGSESPAINYQLADLLLENLSLAAAALEFEKTAYGYPPHEKSSEAGYAAVYTFRKHLKAVAPEEREAVKREAVRSSLKFAEVFPAHEKAAVVLGAAVDDLYGMKEYEQALTAATRLIEAFPEADIEVVRGAWLVVGHSAYELVRYSEAEAAYLNVLELLPEGDQGRAELVDNLAASIYKQGEQADGAEDYRAAAEHFLRVGRMAPTSKIRPTAEYDAAAALIRLRDWERAAAVLTGFRHSFPEHALQPEVTKKLAHVYRENGRLSLAAAEYERIERESKDDEIRREALLVASDLHEKAGNSARLLEVCRRYVGYFPHPVELNLETRNKIARILKAQNERESYLGELEQIVAIDASAGPERTPRTRYLAAQAALVLAESSYAAFAAVRLQRPFEVNLRKKRNLMKAATQKFKKLVDYEIGDITAAATFYLAEIYIHFSKALMTSERPEGLSALEREQYELAIEEQAYPFEEKAIAVHESNLMLISRGVYNEWVEKSLRKLAELVPARYDKPEEASGIMVSLEVNIFESHRPAEPEPAASDFSESGIVETPKAVRGAQSPEAIQAEGPGGGLAPGPPEPATVEEPEPATAVRAVESGASGQTAGGMDSRPSEPAANSSGVPPVTSSDKVERR